MCWNFNNFFFFYYRRDFLYVWLNSCDPFLGPFSKILSHTKFNELSIHVYRKYRRCLHTYSARRFSVVKSFGYNSRLSSFTSTSRWRPFHHTHFSYYFEFSFTFFRVPFLHLSVVIARLHTWVMPVVLFMIRIEFFFSWIIFIYFCMIFPFDLYTCE